MLSMPLGGTGDTTINFGKGDSFDRIFVNAFRYFYSVDESFFLIGSYDETESTNLISVIIRFTDNSLAGVDWNITYHILNQSDRRSLIIWRNVGLPYGKMLSSYHIILEANEVYEKHWFDVGSSHGAIVEFAKTNLSVDKWILIRAKQISLVNNIPEVIIRVPNGTSKADSTYDSQVQQIRESTGRPTNITTFLVNYMKTEY